MNKAGLIEVVENATGLSKSQATKALDAVFDGIVQELKKEESVTLVGFGTFLVRQRAARKGRNPRTKEEIDIPASKAAVFKAGKVLKDSLN